MNILVTGGTGHIGYNLVKRLREDKDNHISVLATSDIPEYLNGLVDNYHQGSIIHSTVVGRAMEDIDVVYHLAANIPRDNLTKELAEEMLRIATGGANNILYSSRQSKKEIKIVIASSVVCCGYSKHGEVIDENSVIDDKNLKLPYVESKVKLEKLCTDNYEDVDVTIARLGKVYGKGDFKARSSFILNDDKKFRLVPPGSSNYVSVDDCVDALILLSSKGKRQEKYNIVSESLPYSVIYGYFAEALGRKYTDIKPPKYLGKVYEFLENIHEALNLSVISPSTRELVNSGFKDKYISSDKIRALGWKPKQTIKEAVFEAVEFYRENVIIK